MNKFNYKASDDSGKIVKGQIESENKPQAFQILKERGLFPIEVNASQKLNLSLDFLPQWKRISNKEILTFITQLATMIRAGMSLILSLDIVIGQINNVKFEKILQEIKANISSGKSLSQACMKYPSVFPPLFANIVKAGEESGKLELVLNRYAEFIKNGEKIRTEIKSAMAYPIILILLSIGVMVFLTTFIVPKFADMLKDSGTELPGSTRMLLSFSNFMQHNYPFVIIGLIISIILLLKFIKTETGRYYFDLFKLKMPIMGTLIFKIMISRFIRTMSTLLTSGVPFLKNLKLALNVLDNKVILKKFDGLVDNISKGNKIAPQFKKTDIFSPVAIQMMTIGENSGTLDKMFEEIADIYDSEIETAVKRLTASMEPLILILVASGIGFIAVSLISAVMKAVSSLN